MSFKEVKALFFTSAEDPLPIFSPNAILMEGSLTKGATSGWGSDGALTSCWVGDGGDLGWGSDGALSYWLGFEEFNTRMNVSDVMCVVPFSNLQDLDLEWHHSFQFSRDLFSDCRWLYSFLLALFLKNTSLFLNFESVFVLPSNQWSRWRSVSILLSFAFDIFYSARFAFFSTQKEEGSVKLRDQDECCLTQFQVQWQVSSTSVRVN